MLRAREPRLLNRERAERMLDAASFEDAAKLLTDCGYPDMSQMKAGEVEQTLAERRSAIFGELDGLCPDKELVDLFKLKYDYHNAKAILKAEAMGSDCRRLLSDSGRVPGGKLLELYNEDRLARLPVILAGAMAEAKAVLARTANPQLSDFVLDKAYFDELRAVADELGSPFLKGYIEILTDSANLKSAVRTLRMGKNQDFLAGVLIEGGGVGVQRIAAAADRGGRARGRQHDGLRAGLRQRGERVPARRQAGELRPRGRLRLPRRGRGGDPGRQNDPHGQACGREAAGHPGKAA